MRQKDNDLVSAIIRDEYVVHIPFKLKIIKYASEHFPMEYKSRKSTDIGSRYYNENVYKYLGL